MNDSPHLGADEAVLLAAYLPARERELLAHALGCPRCQARLRRALAEAPKPPARRPQPPEIAAVRDRVEAGLEEAEEILEAGRDAAEPAVERLLALPREDRHPRIQAEAAFHTLPVALLLLERALESGEEDADRAADLALLALEALGKLDPIEVPAMLLGELRVRAWAVVTRAECLKGNWEAVRNALEGAEAVMVTTGFPGRREGFRRALARLRLTERRMEAVVAAAMGAVNLLLAPFFPELVGEIGEEEADDLGEKQGPELEN
jgi:hypothetical protein